jgi:hypothetical protein
MRNVELLNMPMNIMVFAAVLAIGTIGCGNGEKNGTGGAGGEVGTAGHAGSGGQTYIGGAGGSF